MSFLNPLMLLGLGAVAVPIVIHLLNRRRFRRVRWAAMRFLKASIDRNQRRMRVEDWVLLALRCLLLALLALALARPTFFAADSGILGPSKVAAVIVLDHSLSMGASDGVEQRIDQARAAAEQVVDSLPSGSSAALYLASDTVDPIIPEPTYDLNLVRRTIREARLTDRSTRLFPALEKGAEVLRDRLAPRRELYVITDGQGLGWRDMPEIERLFQSIQNEMGVTVILVGERETPNLHIAGLRSGSGLAPAGQALRFEVQVVNRGKDLVREIPITLGVGGGQPSDQAVIDELGPGMSRTVALFAKIDEPGYHTVTARGPGDLLEADDWRAITVRVVDEVRVLLVDGEPGAEKRSGETYYLEHALTPVPVEYREDYFIQTTRATAGELGAGRFDVDEHDIVVLANVPDFTESAAVMFEAYLRRGGGLMIFPGDRVNRRFYNGRLLEQSRILPAALGEPAGDSGQEERYLTLQSRDYTHPVVRLWNDASVGTLASARFYRWFPLEPEELIGEGRAESEADDEAGVPRVILAYANGLPAVMEREWGLGRVILFGSTADTEWNDFPVRPAFVPFIHRVSGALVQRRDEGLNLRVGDAFGRRLAAEFLDADAAISQPVEGAPPELQRIGLAGKWPLLRYTKTDLAGIYKVNVGEPPMALQFATQPDPEESDLARMVASQEEALRGLVEVIDWEEAGDSLRESLRARGAGAELWLPLILAVLSMCVLETFLGQWFSRPK